MLKREEKGRNWIGKMCVFLINIMDCADNSQAQALIPEVHQRGQGWIAGCRTRADGGR